MKPSDTHKYGHFLKRLTSDELEKLLSHVLKEMRSRDSDLVKDELMATTKALWRVRGATEAARRIA